VVTCCILPSFGQQEREEMDIIKIGEKEYPFKLTVKAWKALKIQGITPTNIQDKLQEDLAGTISNIVFLGIQQKDVKQEDLDAVMDLTVVNQLSELITKSMETVKKDDGPKN